MRSKMLLASPFMLLTLVSVQATARAEPTEAVHEAFACVRSGIVDTCPPPPSFVSTSASDNYASFEVGPFPAGDQILIFAYASTVFWTNTTATSAWTCAPGRYCPLWSDYASGELTQTAMEGWLCGTPATFQAVDVTTSEAAPTTTVYRICGPQ